MVGAHVIHGGLIYVGRHLRSASGGAEPALINPDLPVASSGGRSVEPGPEPAYRLLSPVTRRAYLDWLAGGRRTDVSSGLVLLFCFGLERRVLADGDHDPAVRLELPTITAEVRRLRTRYGDGAPALRGTLDNLLDLLELLTAARAGSASAVQEIPRGRATMMAVRVALARFAAASAPVPADWARAWVRHHPSLTARSAEVSCPAEHDRLFALRYRDRHGSGLVPPDDAPGIRLRYRPASPALATTLVCREDLPDVLAEPRSTRALGALLDDIAVALDPYRRWLARFPQGRGSLAAAALLPPELVDAGHGQLGALRVWGERRLDGRPWAIIDADEFRTFWSTATPERMARDEAAALLDVLGLVGLGAEPDVRFGAPALAPGPAMLFRLGRPASDHPSGRFRAAAAIARCAAAVASTAGPTGPQDGVWAAMLATTRDLAGVLCLAPGEDLRLAARLAWLITSGVDVDRLGRHTALLTEAEREIAGRYLIAVAAAADPAVGPATVAILTRVYRTLGLEPELVFHRLHERSVGVAHAFSGPATRPAEAAPAGDDGQDQPVIVQTAEAVPNGYALPWAMATTMPATLTQTPGAVPIDRAAIMRKLAESSVAATLLTSIFDTDDIADDAKPVAGPAASPVAGLDSAHSALLRALADRPAWTPEEFGSLAAAHGVLPEGAFDLLNEVAIDTVGAPVIEGEAATFAVANDVLLELLS